MEEAKITQTQEKSLVTTDDLFYLIGQKEVANLNKDKIIQVISKQVVDVNPYKKEIQALRESNDALSRKNIELDRALTEQRNLVKAKEGELTEKELRLSQGSKERAEFEEKIKKPIKRA